MITTVSLAIGRHHRAVLLLGLTAAAACLAVLPRSPALYGTVVPVLYVASGAFIVLGLVLLSGARPRIVEVRPRVPAFTTPAGAPDLLFTLGQLALVTGWTSLAVRSAARDEPLIDLRFVLVWSALIVVAVAGRWRGTGLEFTPDGIRDRSVLGTLVVPWEALPATPMPDAADKQTSLPVRCARPELVRRRGLVGRRRLSTDNVDPRLAAQMIRYYVTHPEYRSAIGTETEYRRLLGAIDPAA